MKSWSVRQVTPERGDCGGAESLKSRIPSSRVLALPQRRREPHQRAVGSLFHERIDEQIPLDHVFVGEIAASLLEPVVHEHALVALRDHGAIDAKRSASAKATARPAASAARWEVYTHGGRNPAGIDAVKWARQVEALGAGEILLTSMDADGTKAGYDVALTRAISEAVHIPVIASGGAGSLDHMADVLIGGKADAVLAASIFHFGEYKVADVKKFLRGKGISVRL